MKFHFFRAGQLAVLVWFISSFTGAIQAQVAGGQLKENGQKNLISFQNKQYIDYTIPTTYSADNLYIRLEGADGGKRYNDDLNINYGGGGEGATIETIFKIGTATGQLHPGSTLRFVIGENGTDMKSVSSRGCGGGGGTAILYKQLGASVSSDMPATAVSAAGSNWILLAVAGGGGGAAGTSSNHYNGQPGAVSENGGDGTRGIRGSSAGYDVGDMFGAEVDGKTYGYGGGGLQAYSDEEVDHYHYGKHGGITGGAGGESANQWNSSGGWGYGGGGAGGGATGNDYLVHTGGGGGGGYTGGNGGIELGGLGGMSYVNTGFSIPGAIFKTQHSHTSHPGHGFAEYLFTNEAPASKTIRGTGQVAFGQLMQSGNYHLYWQSDGNLVLYDKTSGSKATWACGAKGTDAKLYFQGDGNLVIYVNGSVKWSTQTADAQQDGNGGRYLVLRSDGQLLILNADGDTIWQAG